MNYDRTEILDSIGTPAAPRGRAGRCKKDEAAGDLQGVRGGLPAVHVPRAMTRPDRRARARPARHGPAPRRPGLPRLRPAPAGSGASASSRRRRTRCGTRRPVARTHRRSLEGPRDASSTSTIASARPRPTRSSTTSPTAVSTRRRGPSRDHRSREDGRLQPRLPDPGDGNRRAPGGEEERWWVVARALSTPTALRIYFGLAVRCSSPAPPCGSSSGGAIRSSPAARRRAWAPVSGGPA